MSMSALYTLFPLGTMQIVSTINSPEKGRNIEDSNNE